MIRSKLYILGLAILLFTNGCIDPITINREERGQANIESDENASRNWWPDNACVGLGSRAYSPYDHLSNAIFSWTSLELIDTKEYWQSVFPGQKLHHPITPDELLSEDATMRTILLDVGYVILISEKKSEKPNWYVVPLYLINWAGHTWVRTNDVYIINLKHPNEAYHFRATTEYGDRSIFLPFPPMEVVTDVMPSDYKSVASHIEHYITKDTNDVPTGVVLLQLVSCAKATSWDECSGTWAEIKKCMDLH
jgi:hypothetical protein